MAHDLSDQDDMRLSEPEEQNAYVSNEEAEKDDDNDDNTASRRIDPKTSKKRIVRNPIPKLNAARLKSSKGVHTIENYFKGFKFHGKGREKEDLDRVMKRLEHWAHRLFPKYQFDDFLEKVEAVGSKKEINTFLIKYRRDMLLDDVIITDDAINGVVEEEQREPEPVDEFDLLIAEQITKTKQAAASQANQSDENNALNSSINRQHQQVVNDKMKNTVNDKMSDSEREIKEKIERNRKLAIERRLAKLKAAEDAKKASVNQPITSPEKQITPTHMEVVDVTSDKTVEDANKTVVNQPIINPEKQIAPTNMEVVDIPIDKTVENDRIIETIENIDLTLDDQSNSLQLQDQSQTNEITPSDTVDISVDNNTLSNDVLDNALTDEQLNAEIDDVVNQFLRRKR